MFRTIFTTLRALLKSDLCATQLCIRSDTASYALSNTIVLLLAKDLERMIILFSWIANFAPKMQKNAWMNELIGRASGPKQELIVTLFLR